MDVGNHRAVNPSDKGVRCDFCRRQVNPKGGISFRLSFMCAACLKARSK